MDVLANPREDYALCCQLGMIAEARLFAYVRVAKPVPGCLLESMQ